MTEDVAEARGGPLAVHFCYVRDASAGSTL